ncbi:MAG TPA: hypothetical protein VHC69_15500 [Polyangiaceae bacterium]|nr:hypothetical protein [Polyangiaceae bacterium]
MPKDEGILCWLELMREKVGDWKQYPFTIPAISKLDRIKLHPSVTFFVGENGSGKSTLRCPTAKRSCGSSRTEACTGRAVNAERRRPAP